MPEYVETAQDLRIKYGQCFTRLLDPKPGEAPIGIITEDIDVDANDKPIRLHCVTFHKGDRNQTISKNRAIPIQELGLFKLPVGAINTAKSVVIVEQSKPEGNARYRSLQHKTCMKLVDPLALIRRKMKLRAPKALTDWFILKEWAEAAYSTPDEALALVETGQAMSRAFSNKFYFTISDKTEHTVLMYLNLAVGRVIDNVIHLRPKATRFKELLEGYGFTCTEEV